MAVTKFHLIILIAQEVLSVDVDVQSLKKFLMTRVTVSYHLARGATKVLEPRGSSVKKSVIAGKLSFTRAR